MEVPPQMEPRSEESPEEADVSGERATLLGLCYRLLGSVADAEDAVQEAYVRWYRLGGPERRRIVSPRAWLITTASRIGLDMLRSARARREQYVGEWLPEPVPAPGRWHSQHDDGSRDPAEAVATGEAVSMALLIVLESMTPAERVAFVLHDVFRYTFPEIAGIVGRSPQACRQLASSARRRVRQARSTPVDPAQHAAVVRSFRSAWQRGDMAALIGLLDPGATAITDGGGLVSAPIEAVHGAGAVAALFLGVTGRQPDLAVAEGIVNGEPGLVATGGGRTLAVIALALTGDRIGCLWTVRNPEKLRAWNPAPEGPPLSA